MTLKCYFFVRYLTGPPCAALTTLMTLMMSPVCSTDADDTGDDSDGEVVARQHGDTLVYTEREFFVWVKRNKIKEVQLALLQGRDVDKVRLVAGLRVCVYICVYIYMYVCR